MSNQTVQADHDELKDIQQVFNAQASAIESVNKNLQSRIETLRGGDWIGNGATAFLQEMDNQVMPALIRLQKALTEASRFAQQASAFMQTAEDEASKILHV